MAQVGGSVEGKCTRKCSFVDTSRAGEPTKIACYVRCPNIIGHASSFASWAGGEFDGVLIKYDGGNANIAGGTGAAINAAVGFNAHNGNSSFGASDTVQPPALQSLACIKT